MTHMNMAVSYMNDKTSLITHVPVLLSETIEAMVQTPEGIYFDATFGRGGHSAAILKRLNHKGRLLALDKDLEAVMYAKKHFNDSRFTIIHASFNAIARILDDLNLLGKINGILFDLGVSSPQLDVPDRGFSFQHDAELDMRMDTTQSLKASTWLAQISEQELAKILWEYGEERFSRRIARAIITARSQNPITSTKQLAEIIIKAVPFVPPFKRKKHPATRSFQAIRMVINQELEILEQGLKQALLALQPKGRLCVISFHSLEDRIVKHFMQGKPNAPKLRHLPIKNESHCMPLQVIGKPIKPSEKEIANNPRARSAILRIAEKRP